MLNKQEIQELVNKHGMKNILEGLIDYLNDIPQVPHEKYIQVLKAGLIKVLNTYENRYLR